MIGKGKGTWRYEEPEGNRKFIDKLNRRQQEPKATGTEGKGNRQSQREPKAK